jgi:hypothetical protein
MRAMRAMSAPGLPKGEHRRAQPEATPMSGPKALAPQRVRGRSREGAP